MKNLELRPSTSAEKSSELGKEWKEWSVEKLEEEKGQLLFMDFTAEWCLTCKVNKKLVLETEGFRKISEEYNMVLLRADWTKRDDNITQFLKKYNVVGVPAYFIQKRNGDIIHLGETISVSEVKKNLNSP